MSAYKGKEKYIFVSYAHKDHTKVLPIIKSMQSEGFRIWYDEGIEAGTEWPAYIENSLKNSAVVVAFISAHSVESVNCRNEINYALLKKKEMLVVYLEKTELKNGLELQLNALQSLYKNRHSSETGFLNELMKAKILQNCKKGSVSFEELRKNSKKRAALKTVLLTPEKQETQLISEKEENHAEIIPANGLKDCYKTETEKMIFPKEYKIGDVIKFGSYPQNHDFKEPVEWQILDIKDGKVLLLSKYALDCRSYPGGSREVTWENCGIRKWLNQSFLNSAFSESEQLKIDTVTVSADQNPQYDTNQGNDTQDKIFLLSVAEVNKYFRKIGSKACKPTNFALENDAYVDRFNGNCMWWLRSTGKFQNWVSFVDSTGRVSVNGFSVFDDEDETAVRPALWMNLND